MKLNRIITLLLVFTLSPYLLQAKNKNGSIKGKVLNQLSREPLPFVNIIVEGTNIGGTSDINGDFLISGVTPGYVKLVASSIGYKTKVTSDIFVTQDKIPYVEILLESSTAVLTEIEIQGPQFVKRDESPVSMQTIGIREIERNPGGNRDISKVIQSLPGVASTPSFRNDIIIRGGSPSENKFYLDGVEIPVINHFQTQGSTGGPVGIINVNFIREVDFYSGAFPASRGNAMSSVMEFKQIEGSREKTGLRATLGSSEVGLTADGPIGNKTNYIISVRRSYLRFLFSIFKLPFLPTFTDVQLKVNHRFNKNNELILLGLGAIDKFELNKKVNERVTDPEQLELNNYILGYLPVNNQWNYTTGAVYKHYGKKSVSSFIFSRNELNNTSTKYIDNDDSRSENQLLDYSSTETENKFRYEHSTAIGEYKIISGLNFETGSHTVKGFKNRVTSTGPVSEIFDNELMIYKYGAFASVSKPLFESRLIVSAGLRLDANTYSSSMNNPFEQFSPRLAASWNLTEKWSLNFNTGKYFQLPAYTILGHGNQNGELINKKNKITYINSDHVVAGVQFNPNLSTKITVEGFSKYYRNYPFSVANGISLANLGSDFGVVGNEEVTSTSKGRAYGLEFLAQRRSRSGIYGIIAITFVRSEFSNGTKNYVPSAWDNKYLTTLTGGKKLGNDWELGAKWRFVSGRPYTPYNVEASALKANWDVSGQGIPDYSQLNSKRLSAFHQLDLRIDKSYFFKKWSANIYLDIQNVYNFKARNNDILNVRRDANGLPISNSSNPDQYEIYFIKDESGIILPSIGIIVDF